MKKNAAAACQNWQAIENAKKNGGLFGAVIKRLGNGGFQVQLQQTGKGRLQVQASPRGLFTNGSMKITVGHVVLLSGELMPVGTQQRPLEIVGRLDNKAEIRDLIRAGHMPASVLAIADSASASESAQQVAEDDLFESDDSDEDFWVQGVADVRGGLKAERKAQETAATIAARVASLKGARSAAASGLKRKGMDGGVDAGDMADPLLFSDPEYQRFNRWRAHKESAVKMAGGGSTAAAAPLAVPMPAASQTVEELMALFRLEQETARMAAEQAAIADREDTAARTVALRAELAGQTVKDNWDDEEDLVDINDL